MATLSVPPSGAVQVRPWADDVVDRLGHDPRSAYVERFWLGVVGPSTVWLLRRVAAELEASPEGFELRLAPTAQALGLGGAGSSSTFVRTINRACQFALARPEGPGVLGVRRKLPPLNRGQLARLPEEVQAEHRAWVEGELGTPELERLRRRSRRLALSLVELGEDLDAVEQQLLRWHFHPALCFESAAWAWQRHREACAAAEGAGAA